MQEMNTIDQGEVSSSLRKLAKLPGTAQCGVCKKTISGNKVYCFAHIPVEVENKAIRKYLR